MSRPLTMTLDEAVRIRRNARDGVLDLDLPGTREEVRLAERTCASADLWGRSRQDQLRSRFTVVAIVVTTLLISAIALLPYGLS